MFFSNYDLREFAIHINSRNQSIKNIYLISIISISIAIITIYTDIIFRYYL